MPLTRSAITPIALLILMSACGPTYTGPTFSQVMNGTCAGEKTMADLYACVDQYWYQPVSAAGLGDNPNATRWMGEGRKLLEEVRGKKTKDQTAMAHWRTLAAAEKERQAANAQAMQDLGQSLQRTADQMRPVQCNTVYGSMTSSTSCY